MRLILEILRYINSELSTFPIIVIIYHGCVFDVVLLSVASYRSRESCVCFHYYSLWYVQTMRYIIVRTCIHLFARFAISLSSWGEIVESIEHI